MEPALPTATTATLTFLFTDIEGSTARWENQREAMSAALVRHDEILRCAIEGSGGHVFKTIGDAFYGAFDDAAAALDAALDAQRALAKEDWSVFGPDFSDLRVRMAIHHGKVEARGGDYFGPPLNRTARLVSAGHGGQVLLSMAAQQVLRDYLPAGVALRDLGEHRLKDLRHSEHVWQVLAPGVPEVTTPLVTADRVRPRDRIVVDETGAERSTADTLSELLATVRSDERAVTLTTRQIQQVLAARPSDLTEYRLARIAEWSQPRYRLDGRFVALTLLVDKGEAVVGDRWVAKEERYDDLGRLLAEVPDPAVVVLGPPGCGKSTLLRHVGLETGIAVLRGEDARDTVTFFNQLNQYGPERPGDPPPAPREWLARRWAARFPELPPLEQLLAAGRLVLLLDALNEMPAGGEREMHERLQLWKAWLQRIVAEHPGNRIVFSCRTLDYSAPLSTPELRVPQVRIEPLSDEQVVEFLRAYSPVRWQEMWTNLQGGAELEVLRSPYFLALFVGQVEATGEKPAGRAALFTGFVRQALRREVERGNSLFEPGQLLDGRDVKRIAAWQWRTPCDLPERGVLLPKLAGLAHGMQERAADGERSQVRAALDEALALLDDPNGEAIVAAGEALAVLDEDQADEALMYVHQLVQEYFAARRLAPDPERAPRLVARPWRAAEVTPTVGAVIDSLAPADPLPMLPQRGWEETTVLAAAMTADPEALARRMMDANLALAGRIATQGEVRARLPEAFLAELRWALVKRSRDPAADLRDRIACGYALGDLGDPRYEHRTGPYGEYSWPRMIEIPGGVYPIGDNEPIEWKIERSGERGTDTDSIPRHEVAIAGFRIGQFAVTNAEWACFVDSGGYDDERWWDTADSKRWQRGELANEGARLNNRLWRRRFRDDPTLFDRMIEDGLFASEAMIERWRGWMALDEEGFERAMDAHWLPKRRTEPLFWRDERYNRASQPVVGTRLGRTADGCRRRRGWRSACRRRWSGRRRRGGWWHAPIRGVTSSTG
jgi:class 3 adenylate cyclase